MTDNTNQTTEPLYSDDYVRGWDAADEAIAFKALGHQDFSQGQTAWDEGWNARLEVEQERSR